MKSFATALDPLSRQFPSASPQAISKARTQAQDFESVFLNTMLQSMAPAEGGDPTFSGGQGASTWRSIMNEEMAKSVAANGGLGLADHVARELLAQQERGRTSPLQPGALR
jgi:Rod binding domain-containing protein